MIGFLLIGLFASRKAKEEVRKVSANVIVPALTVSQSLLAQRSTSDSAELVVVTATVTAFETSSISSTQASTLTNSITTTEVTTLQAATTLPSIQTAASVTVTATEVSTYTAMSSSYKPTTTTQPTITTLATSRTSSIDAAVESSIQAVLSSLSAEIAPHSFPASSSLPTSVTQPTTTAHPTSITAPTLASPTASPTPTNGELLGGGHIGFCSVPGSACNEKRHATHESERHDSEEPELSEEPKTHELLQGGHIGFCSVPGSACNEKRGDAHRGESEVGGELETDGHEIDGTVELGGDGESSGQAGRFNVMINGTMHEGHETTSLAASATQSAAVGRRTARLHTGSGLGDGR